MLYMLEEINSNKFPWLDEGFLKIAVLGAEREIKKKLSELLIIYCNGYKRANLTSDILGSNLVSLAQLSLVAPPAIWTNWGSGRRITGYRAGCATYWQFVSKFRSKKEYVCISVVEHLLSMRESPVSVSCHTEELSE